MGGKGLGERGAVAGRLGEDVAEPLGLGGVELLEQLFLPGGEGGLHEREGDDPGVEGGVGLGDLLAAQADAGLHVAHVHAPRAAGHGLYGLGAPAAVVERFEELYAGKPYLVGVLVQADQGVPVGAQDGGEAGDGGGGDVHG